MGSSITEENKKSINEAMMFLKGIGCIGVVFIHIKFPANLGQLISKAAQFAVPVFIMISGYFSYGISDTVIIRRVRKNIIIFLVAFFLYVLYYGIPHILHHDFLTWLLDCLNYKFLIKMVLFCTIDFAVPLWYLIAMIECYLIWKILRKKIADIRFIKILMCLLFFFRILLTIYVETKDISWYLKINVFLSALPFFLFGLICREEKTKECLNSVSNLVLGILSFMGYIIACIPILVEVPIDFSCIGIILYSLGVFTMAVNNPDIVINKWINSIGDKLSLYIYILHVPVGGSVIKLLEIVVGEVEWIYWIYPIITLIVSLFLSIIIYKCKGKCELYGKKR